MHFNTRISKSENQPDLESPLSRIYLENRFLALPIWIPLSTGNSGGVFTSSFIRKREEYPMLIQTRHACSFNSSKSC